MKLDSIITPELALLESLQRGTDPLTRKNLQVMHENFVVPYSRWLKGQYTLLEAEMTADQITQAFGYAEKIATAGGDNRSMLGKGADVAGSAASAVGAGAKAVGAGAADLAVKGAKGAKDLAAKLVPQAVKDKFTKSLPPADAGPVEGFEQKATQAIAGIQDPKAKQSLMDKIKIGLQNPATQQLIMVGVSGIAGVIASTATAGIGGYAGAAAAGAITGSLLGAINAKMQGKSWGDTGKAALKGAALGAAGGLIGKGITDAGAAAVDAFKGSNAPGLPAADAAANRAADENAASQWAAGTPEERAQIEQTTGMSPEQLQAKIPADPQAKAQWEKLSRREDALAQMATMHPHNPDGTASPEMSRYMQAQAETQAAYNKINPGEGNAPINPNAGQQQVDLNNMVQNKIDTGAIPAPQGQASQLDTPSSDFSQAEIDAPIKPSAEVQQIASQEAAKYGRVRPSLEDWRAANMLAKGGGVQTQSRVNTGKPINENVDYELTARMWALRNRVGKPYSKIHMTEAAIRRAFEMAASSQLNEGPLDWIKKKAGQAADFVKTKVGNVTNKITADKLQQAWTKAGSPTDSVEVGKIMAANGVPQDSVDQILKNMGVPNAPAAPAQAGADAGGTTPPTQAPTPETPPTQDPAQAGGATPPAKAGGRDIPVDPSSVAPPDANGAITTRLDNPGNNNAPAGFFNPNGPKTGASTPPTQAQAGGTSTPPTNKEIAQGAIAKAQDSSKGGLGPTNVTGTIQKGAEELQGITGAIKAGQGMGTSGTSLMQPRDGSSTAGEVKIKDEKGQEHAYKKVGQKWYDKDNKEVPPAIAAMLDKQAQQQAALGKDKNAAPLAGPQGEIPGAKPPVPAKPGATPPATAGATAPAPAKEEPVKIGGQTLDPKNPADKKLDPRDLNKDGTVDATEKSIARNQAKTGATPPAQTPATTAATPPAATTVPASQSPEEIRKAKQADAAKAAQAQMAANPSQTATPPVTEPAATAEPVPGETPAQTAAKKHTGGRVAGAGLSQTPNAIRQRDARAAAAQAKTTGNDVMGRMAKQLGAAPAGGPAQAEPTATPAATPDFSKTMTGYGKTTTNAPTGVPSVAKPAVPAATNATTEPATAPAAEPAKPGFLQTATDKIAAKKAAPEPMVTASIDFSAALLRKMKQRV